MLVITTSFIYLTTSNNGQVAGLAALTSPSVLGELPVGCVSTTGRCQGACAVNDWHQKGSCAARGFGGTACVRIKATDGTFRYECWTAGPDWGGLISFEEFESRMRSGFDFANPNLNTIAKVSVRRQWDSPVWHELPDTMPIGALST